MLRYVLLACLCLTALVQAQLREEYRKTYHESPTGKAYEDYIISPDTFDDRSTFAVAHFKENPDQKLRQIHVKLALFNDGNHAKSKECSFVLQAKPDTYEWGVTSLRRLDENIVVLTWYNWASNEVNPTSQVLVYDAKRCGRIFLNYNLEKVLDRPVVVPEPNSQFDVFIDDFYSCEKKFGKCWMHYDLTRGSRKIHKFDSNLVWSSMKIERLSGGDLLVQGLYPGDSVHGVFRMNHTIEGEPSLEPVVEMTNGFNRRINVVSSGLSFSWFTNPGKDTQVRCLQVNDAGKVVFNETLSFDEPRKLIDVRTTREGELLLISQKVECGKDEECLWATRVGKDLQEHTWLDMPCVDEARFTVLYAKYDEEWRRTTLHYGCRKGHGFHFGFKHIY